MNEISPINFFKYYQNHFNMKIIDIRKTNEYEKYHIQDSTNIPYHLLLEKHNLFMNHYHTYFIICKNGNLSYQASKYLSMLGYNVVNVIGGIDNWKGMVITKFA